MKKLFKRGSILFLFSIVILSCQKESDIKHYIPYFGENDVLYARTEHNDYILATYSFEYATRDDKTLTHNDWDILYGNGNNNWGRGGAGGGKDGNDPGADGSVGMGGSGNPNALAINTVTDDRSTIADLGVIDFDSLRSIPFSADFEIEAVADTGHVYVIHTVDDNSDIYTKFVISSMKSDDWIKFSWVRSRDNKKF